MPTLIVDTMSVVVAGTGEGELACLGSDGALCGEVLKLGSAIWQLAMAADGQLSIGGPASVWRWLPAATAVAPAPSESASVEPTIDVPRSALPPFEQFMEQGYCMLPGLVSAAKSQCALRLINHHLGSTQSRQVAAGEHGLGAEFLYQDSDGCSSDEPAGVVKLGTLALHPDLNCGLLGPVECETLARALRLAPAQIKPPAGCQLALRFPLPPTPWNSDSSRNDISGELRGQQQASADIDSLEGLRGRLLWHTDLNKYNDRKSFDFVVGVFLSPVRRAQDGALWVLPTSHLTPTPTPAAALQYAAAEKADPTPILTCNPVSRSKTSIHRVARPVCCLRACVASVRLPQANPPFFAVALLCGPGGRYRLPQTDGACRRAMPWTRHTLCGLLPHARD